MFIKQNIPHLENEAKFDLLFYCIFIMQESLRHFTGEDLQKAKSRVQEVLNEIAPVLPVPDASMFKKLLLKMAQIHFLGTCKLLNFLIDIHILT